jgi:hypothetical protein
MRKSYCCCLRLKENRAARLIAQDPPYAGKLQRLRMHWLATVAQMQVVRREKRHHREQQGHTND